MSGCPRGLWLRYARPGSRFADVSAIRAIDAVDRGVPPDAPTRMTARLLDTDSHGLYASGGSPWPVRSGWMSCRCGAGCARRRDWAGRVGGDEDPSPRLQAYGKARLPDEVSRTGAGCTAGRGHAQATPLGDDPHHAPTRANTGSPQSQHGPTGSGAVGGLRGGDGFEHNLKAVHHGRGCQRAQVRTKDAR